MNDGGKNKIPATYEAQAQKDWLNENPLVVIASEENLNRASFQDAAYIPPAQQPNQSQSQSQRQQPLQSSMQIEEISPELVEDSILIPEEAPVVEEEAKADEETAAKKKTIRFNV